MLFPGNDRVRIEPRDSVCTKCGVEHRIQIFVFASGATLPKNPDRILCDFCYSPTSDETAEQRVDPEERIAGLIAEAGANPFAHGRCSLDNYDTAEAGERATRAIRWFVSEVKRTSAKRFEPMQGLYLYGHTGCGKTHLAVAALRELLTKGIAGPHELVFDRSRALIRQIQESYSSGEESTGRVLERRVRAKVWILDDLGTEQASADAIRHLTDILSDREMRPTLITSNLPPEELADRNPAYRRLLSRLGAECFHRYEVTGRDRRQG